MDCTLDNDLKVGDRVKIITENANQIYEVTKAEATRFQVNQLTVQNSELTTVFVYGREVNDFHTVDYEAISMLNVSATQQLAKENEVLKQRVTELEAQVNQISELKAMLQALQQQVNGEKVTVSAEK